MLSISEILGDASPSGIFLQFYKCNAVGSRSLCSEVSGVPVSFEKPLGCSGAPALYFFLLSSSFCLPFAETSAACNSEVKSQLVNSEDLHYGVLPHFPSMLWSARELAPLLTFIISRTVPVETFLSEVVPTYCLEHGVSFKDFSAFAVCCLVA